MITIEIYSNQIYQDSAIRQPLDLSDATDFLERTIPERLPFIDLYVDYNDTAIPMYQKTFCLLGCTSKIEAINFVMDIWRLL
jgi:hypothetical protein